MQISQYLSSRSPRSLFQRFRERSILADLVGAIDVHRQAPDKAREKWLMRRRGRFDRSSGLKLGNREKPRMNRQLDDLDKLPVRVDLPEKIRSVFRQIYHA
jgi:hypothetical protein